MDKETFLAVSASANVIAILITVVGWVVTNRANNKNSLDILKLQEVNSAIDEMYEVLRKNYESILLEFSDGDSTLEYYKRVNYVERIRLLCSALYQTRKYDDKITEEEVNKLVVKLRQISTDDTYYDDTQKISTPSRAISLINQFAKVFYKELS